MSYGVGLEELSRVGSDICVAHSRGITIGKITFVENNVITVNADNGSTVHFAVSEVKTLLWHSKKHRLYCALKE